mgnify:CR=1 FL=1
MPVPFNDALSFLKGSECIHMRVGQEPCVACGGNRESDTKDPSIGISDEVGKALPEQQLNYPHNEEGYPYREYGNNHEQGTAPPAIRGTVDRLSQLMDYPPMVERTYHHRPYADPSSAYFEPPNEEGDESRRLAEARQMLDLEDKINDPARPPSYATASDAPDNLEDPMKKGLFISGPFTSGMTPFEEAVIFLKNSFADEMKHAGKRFDEDHGANEHFMEGLHQGNLDNATGKVMHEEELDEAAGKLGPPPELERNIFGNHFRAPQPKSMEHNHPENNMAEEHPLHGVDPQFGRHVEDRGPSMPDPSQMHGSANPEDHDAHGGEEGNRAALRELAASMGNMPHPPEERLNAEESMAHALEAGGQTHPMSAGPPRQQRRGSRPPEISRAAFQQDQPL